MHPPSELAEIVAAYEHYNTVFSRYVRRRLRIPQEMAETLVEEVFQAILGRPEAMKLLRAWLIGAIAHAGSHRRWSREEEMILRWRFVDGCTAGEIAARLGCSARTADRRLWRALRRVARSAFAAP